MATLRPFRALRPRPSDAARIAAVPYDVVSTDEARALAGDNPLSFLRVSRAEIEFPPGTDPYSDAVYRRAADNFDTLKKDALVVEDEASVYLYRLRPHPGAVHRRRPSSGRERGPRARQYPGRRHHTQLSRRRSRLHDDAGSGVPARPGADPSVQPYGQRSWRVDA